MDLLGLNKSRLGPSGGLQRPFLHYRFLWFFAVSHLAVWQHVLGLGINLNLFPNTPLNAIEQGKGHDFALFTNFVILPSSKKAYKDYGRGRCVYSPATRKSVLKQA